MPHAAAIYARISRDRIGAGLGVDRQLADCQELAVRLGWTVAAVHTDNDLSAYSGKPRPGYRALLADLSAGTIDAVIAWHTDRLHRSPTELEHYITVCERTGAPTHCVKAGVLDLTTASGRMTARILGAVARQEVEHSIERIRGQKMHAARAGRFRGGRRPFGYEADGVTKRPDEAAAVADASQRVLYGESLSSIAREWNNAGLPSSTGHLWTPVSLRRVLLRARNAALVEHHGQEIASACWPALVGEDVWRALRVLLGDPARRRASSNEHRWLGSGLYRCGRCGDGTAVRSATDTGGRKVYRCKRVAHLARSAAPIDEFVTMVVLARLSRPDARLLLRQAPDENIDALRDEAAALRVRETELIAMFTDGVIGRAGVVEGKARISARLSELSKRMANAAAGSSLLGFADAADVTEAWQAASVSRRKAVIDTLMTVTLLPTGRGMKTFDLDTVKIQWKGD